MLFEEEWENEAMTLRLILARYPAGADLVDRSTGDFLVEGTTD